MRRVLLTDASIRSLACPAGKDEEIFWDQEVPGFGLRVRRTGGHAWVVKSTIGGRPQKITIGPPHLFTVKQARNRAKDLLADIRRGADPAQDKRNKRALADETLGALAPRFLARKELTLKRHTLVSYRRGILVYFRPLHHLPVREIDRRAIAKQVSVLAETHGGPAADSARSALSSFFAWAVQTGFADSNPVAFTATMSDSRARERVVSDEELRRIWMACIDTHYCTVVKLLILTGARFREIGWLRWPEIDFDQALISLPATRVKINRPHLIPLAPPALAILEEHKRRAVSLEIRDGLVFGYFSKTGLTDSGIHKTRLDARIVKDGGPILPWVHHDFRRSMSTTMHERLGIQPQVVEACLGHVGHRIGIAGVYNRATYLDERRRALARWADHVMAVVGGEPARGNVVNLRAS
jgi:integrase